MTNHELIDQLDDLAEMVGVWSEVAGRARLFTAKCSDRNISRQHRAESQAVYSRCGGHADDMVAVLRAVRRLLVDLLDALEADDQAAVGQLIPQIVATNERRDHIGRLIDSE